MIVNGGIARLRDFDEPIGTVVPLQRRCGRPRWGEPLRLNAALQYCGALR